MGGVFSRMVHLQTPPLTGKGRGVKLGLGILNIFLPGVGTIVAGILDSDTIDIVIGLLQVFVPIVGWIWGIVWGVLMIIRSLQTKAPVTQESA
mmetsp:Transcript_5440/g.16222  ORF Transcript_5440/g.16222 Transcript_5440/m.16222 type:complete len:93 (-) Transcript_5440:74-352(-)